VRHAGQRAFQILATPKHGGQFADGPPAQQPPAARTSTRSCSGQPTGTCGRTSGPPFANVAEAPVLDALLRRTHWLADRTWQLCVQQVGRGTWWADADLQAGPEPPAAGEAAKIGDWVAASGAHEAVQDERLEKLGSTRPRASRPASACCGSPPAGPAARLSRCS
jgi:hypothetical protein